MNLFRNSIIGLIVIALLPGCIPEQRVIWSPDGRQAMVLGREDELQSLYLCDGNGALSPRLFEHVHLAAWRPDSRGIILVRSHFTGSWTELEPFLSTMERDEIAQAAGAVRAGHARTGGFEILESIDAVDNFKNAVMLYLRHHHAGLFKAQEKAPLRVLVNRIQTGTVQDQTIQIDKTVSCSTMPVWGLRVSPANRAVAYTLGDSGGKLSLYIASLDETPRVKRIAEHVSMYPDWSADGRSVVYAVSSGKADGGLSLGAVAQTRVADTSGRLLKEETEREELVGLIMNNLIRVRCLPDGGIVFSAFEISLPATADDMPDHMTLFTIHPSRRPIVSRILPRNVESRFSGDRSMFYEFSPDYNYIVFPDDDDGLVVLHFSTGKLRQVGLAEPAHLPSWRTANELCCSPCPPEMKHPGVVLYSLDEEDAEPRVLSDKWPAELLRSLVDQKKEKD